MCKPVVEEVVDMRGRGLTGVWSLWQQGVWGLHPPEAAAILKHLTVDYRVNEHVASTLDSIYKQYKTAYSHLETLDTVVRHQLLK